MNEARQRAEELAELAEKWRKREAEDGAPKIRDGDIPHPLTDFRIVPKG